MVVPTLNLSDKEAHTPQESEYVLEWLSKIGPIASELRVSSLPSTFSTCYGRTASVWTGLFGATTTH